jgi:DNA polymerase (family 10)
MPIHNQDIASIFNEVADLLEIGGANPYRVRAYRNAAQRRWEPGDVLNTRSWPELRQLLKRI